MKRPEDPKYSSSLSDFILGGQDGIVSVLGVILGVAIFSRSYTIVLVSGLSAAFSESVAMAAVAYTSTLARRNLYQRNLNKEEWEMAAMPDEEKEEIVDILKGWGFQGPELDASWDYIITHPKAMLELMMAFELHLAPVAKGQARRSALVVGSSTLVGSLIPILPFIPFLLFGGDVEWAIITSIVTTSVVLFTMGWFEAKLTVGRPSRSGLQMTVIGVLSALAGFAIGLLITLVV